MNVGESVPVSFVYVSDRAKGMAFYRDVLGFEVVDSDAFGDTFQAGSALLRMTVLDCHRPSEHPVFGLQVRDIHEEVGSLRGKGVTFTAVNPGGAEAAVWNAPDGRTKLAFFSDPDGNVFTLSETTT